MNLFIYLCIVILNVLAVFLTYRFLGKDSDKKEKFIFIIVGVAVMYMLVTLVYWLSTKNININLGEGASTVQNLITFTFVPVNAIVVLPFLARSYSYVKTGKLEKYQFRNRIILLAVILFVVLLVEFFYFKNIQIGILNIIDSKS